MIKLSLIWSTDIMAPRVDPEDRPQDHLQHPFGDPFDPHLYFTWMYTFDREMIRIFLYNIVLDSNLRNMSDYEYHVRLEGQERLHGRMTASFHGAARVM